MTIKWSDITSMPELDNNDHYEHNIIERGVLCHYRNNHTNLIYKADEYELIVNDSAKDAIIVGYYNSDNKQIILDPRFNNMKESDLPTIKDMVGA